MFDYNPVLWEVMEILAPSKKFFLCKHIVRNYFFIGIVKSAISGNSKRTPKLVFNIDYCLMQVKLLQNAPLGAFCNTFDLH